MNKEALYEEELVDKTFLDGDSFEAFYKKYFPKIYRYVYYRVHDLHEVDDIVSIVFEKVITRSTTYQSHKGSITPWLYAIARNSINDYFRFKQRRERFLNEMKIHEDLVDLHLPEDNIIKRERYGELYEALNALSEREHHILGLKFGSGLTNRRIAKYTGLTESNVGVIIYRSVRRLKELLDERNKACG